MLKLLRQFDRKCEEHVSLLVLLLITVILRIPNFFEPYWYGDEAIYLTIGNGLKEGLRLYTDIIDHKTPLIYYLAMVPDQFSFRLLNLAWMMASTAFLYVFAKRFFGKSHSAFFATLIFVILTTLPWLEGNIPNGELFVLGFVLAGLWLFSKTALFTHFLAGKYQQALETHKKDLPLLVSSGILLGLGVLTKVPALLDFGAVLLVAWFSFSSVSIRAALKTRIKAAQAFISKSIWLTAGLLIPILLSILYFVVRGSGQDYLDYGLLYNLRYSGSWQLEFTNPLLSFLFTLPGKTLLLAGGMIALSFWKKYTPRFRFAAGWLLLTLFAALLSNRPYPHYFIQVVPAFSLLAAELWHGLSRIKHHKTQLITGAGLLALPLIIAGVLNVRPYSTIEYYQRFWQLVTRQISMETYDQSFNGFVKDNYEAAGAIHGLNGHRIFIWGTNPMLYALTQTTPTSRFTVAFHIKDFQDYENTLNQIKAEKPKIIVVMKDEPEEFPGLQQYLDALYYPNNQYDTMTIYLLRENGR